MPWKETYVMNEKVRFIADWLSGEYNLIELAEKYAVSRKTLYKWKDRYLESGPGGLKEHSRAPLSSPKATSLEIISYILGAKSKHTKWGARKLVAYLERQYPDKHWPAVSTAQQILKREGWVKSRHRRHHAPPYSEPFVGCQAPNDVWCADYKGQFRLGEGRLCYPFTLTDAYSRYLLSCQGLYHPRQVETKQCLERAFREYGLPLAMRTDNGAPFASVALGGLSSLAVWLVKLGIRPERIEPGKPEQNGRHERFHRTLKEMTVKPPRQTLKDQQRAFNRFTAEYNQERPHEALGQKPPAMVYRSSPRIYPAKVAKIEYPSYWAVRQVRIGGAIKWKGNLIYVSKALTGEPIGLKQVQERLWEVYFSFISLGTLDENLERIIPA